MLLEELSKIAAQSGNCRLVISTMEMTSMRSASATA